MSMERIRVFLSDSRVVFREGMHFILDTEEDMEVVGEGRTAEEVIAFLQRQPVDVLVLSQDMEDAVRPIAKMFPSVGLVFVSDACSQQQVAEGNPIFLTKDMNPEELAPAVRKASCNYGRAPIWNGTDGMEEARQSPMEYLLPLAEVPYSDVHLN